VLVRSTQKRWWQRALQLHEPWEGGEVSWLHLNLRGVRVGHVARTSQRCIDRGSEVGVLADDVLLAGRLHALPLFLHLPEHLGALALASS